MSKNNTKRVQFTLRVDQKVNEKLEKEAALLGMSKNAYISMLLHKEINKMR